MIVYILGTILSVSITWICSKIKYEKESIWHTFLCGFFSMLPLLLISGMRYGVGQDYWAYRSMYERIRAGGIVTEFEPIYLLINKALAIFQANPVWLFFISSFIFLMFVYVSIYNDSTNFSLSVYLLICMGYYFTFMNGMRQLIACAILLYSLKFVQERSLKPFLLCIILACGFHYSSLVFVAVYWIDKIKINFIMAAILTAIGIFLAGPIGKLVNKLILLTPYARFLGTGFDDSKKVGHIVLMLSVVLILFGSVYYDKNNKKFKLYYKLQIITLWMAAFSGTVVGINRIRWIFGLSSIIYLPLVLDNVKNKDLKKIYTFAIILLYGAYSFYTIGINNSNNVLPYSSVFSEVVF